MLKSSPHSYPQETAGRLALGPMPIASGNETVGTVRDRLRSQDYAIVDLVLVVDGEQRCRGAVTLGDLVRQDDTRTLESLVRTDWPRVAPTTDQEYAVELAAQPRVVVLPVVTDQGRVVGCLAATAMLDVLAREHREDVHRLVGILRERAGARHALEDPPLHRLVRRLP